MHFLVIYVASWNVEVLKNWHALTEIKVMQCHLCNKPGCGSAEDLKCSDCKSK